MYKAVNVFNIIIVIITAFFPIIAIIAISYMITTVRLRAWLWRQCAEIVRQTIPHSSLNKVSFLSMPFCSKKITNSCINIFINAKSNSQHEGPSGPKPWNVIEIYAQRPFSYIHYNCILRKSLITGQIYKSSRTKHCLLASRIAPQINLEEKILPSRNVRGPRGWRKSPWACSKGPSPRSHTSRSARG